MGTDYKIDVANGSVGIYLEVIEHSNKLDIGVRIGACGQIDLGLDLTPEDLANVGLELIKVASYWAKDREEFCKKVIGRMKVMG